VMCRPLKLIWRRLPAGELTGRRELGMDTVEGGGDVPAEEEEGGGSSQEWPFPPEGSAGGGETAEDVCMAMSLGSAEGSGGEPA
jgi:hypothetical protein